MLRKFLIGAGVLLAVLVIAAIALVTLVDVNRFKPQIEQFVQDRYQRSLRIDGDLGLSVFPRIALSLPPSSLSEPGGTGEAARLAGAKVSVAVMPLLRGEIVADKVTVDGLKATIERRSDGSLSIDDLIKPADPSAPPTPPTSPTEPAGKLPRLDIGGISLTNGQVIFQDQQAGNTVTISRLDLNTGRIANKGVTPVTLKLAFATTKPQASGELDLKADAQLDLDLNVFGANGLDATLKAISGTTSLDMARLKLASLSFDPAKTTMDLSGLDLEARGKLAADSFEATARAPRLALTETSATGDALQAVLKLSGSQVVEARIDATGVGGNTNALTVAKLAIDAMTRQGERTVQAKLATPVKANLPAGVVELPGLAGTVVINDPAIPQKTATIELTAAVSADSQKEMVHASLNATAQDMAMVAKVDVNGFSQPKIGFDVNADRLDVDRYFPPGPPAGAKGTAPPAGGGTGGAGGAGGVDTPVDLSALADLNLDGKLSIGQLQARGIKASDLRVTMKAANGQLDAAPMSAAVYGGRLAATAALKAGATPAANRINATADLTDILIGPLLRDVADKDLLEGRGSLKLVLAADGGTVNTLKRGLDGTAALNLRDGAIKGINLGETIRSARNLLKGGGQAETKASDATKKTDFTELSVSFVIKDGVASSNDLDAKSPLIRLGGEGRADLAASRLDYTVRASVVGTSTGQAGKELEELRGVTIPVRLTGPFDKLDWQIDWDTAGKEALKSRANAELKERLKTEDLEGKAKEKLGDSLKGLFKR
jgi:AsmA protein